MASKAEELLTDMVQQRTSTTKSQVQELVAKGRAAQAVYDAFSQEQVDAIVKAIGKYVYDNAEMLARMAIDETGTLDERLANWQSHRRQKGSERRGNLGLA